MAIAALAIGNLSTPALYVASFHVEVFSDAGYTQLVSSQSCPAVKDASGNNWVQSQLITVTNLVRGATYFIQAGPVSPGGVANFNRYSVQAGTLSVPVSTYSGTFAATTSGITYDITVGTPASDIDHYEAIWTKDGSAPSNSSLTNNWTGMPLPNGLIHIFVGGSPGQTIHLFMRGVSTSGGYQNWFAVDNRTISAASSGGSTSATGITYADGQTVESLKPAQAGADVTGANTAADTAAVNGINSGHISDTATSVGFLGKWWRTSSTNMFPTNGGELPYPPMFTTQDAQINYNIFTYSSFVGALTPPSFAPFGPNNDGKWIYVRWTGYFLCPTTGTYTFGTSSDDGANLYVNGTKLIADMHVNGHGTSGNLNPNPGATGSISLTAGDTYEIVVEYYNNAGGAGIQVVYTPPGTSGFQLLNLGTAFKNANFIHYTDGTPVDALKPAAAGADVTAVNISADTSAVSGRPAPDIANTVLAGGGIDYTHSGNQNFPQNVANLLLRGSFEDGQTGTWSANGGTVNVSGQPFSKAMKLTQRDTYGNGIMVTEGQRIYISAFVNTMGIPANVGYVVRVGMLFQTPSPGAVNTWVSAVNVSPQTNWTDVSGFVTVPSGNIIGVPWLEIDGFDFTANPYAEVAALFYTKTAVVDFSEATHANKNASNIPYSNGASVQSLQPAQAGADVTGQNTANNTNNVASVPASTIAQVVPSGFKLFINSGNRSYSIQAI